MDAELLIYLALFVIYLVFQVLAQRKKQRHPSPDQEDHDFSLDDALREIRGVLTGTEPERTPAPEPTPEQPRSLAELATSSADPAPETSTAQYIEDADIPDVTLERLGRSGDGVSPTSVLRRLRSRDAAREAVLLGEILGPPRARRPGPPFRAR